MGTISGTTSTLLITRSPQSPTGSAAIAGFSNLSDQEAGRHNRSAISRICSSDTFAVEMLIAGVPPEPVSILLGPESVKITEKHYAPGVKARQEPPEENVRRALV
jgi:hypothetical protein